MSDKTIEAILASPPERDELVVQLFLCGGGQWGEIHRQDGIWYIEVFPQDDGQPRRFPLEEFIQVISLAGQQLKDRLG